MQACALSKCLGRSLRKSSFRNVLTMQCIVAPYALLQPPTQTWLCMPSTFRHRVIVIAPLFKSFTIEVLHTAVSSNTCEHVEALADLAKNTKREEPRLTMLAPETYFVGAATTAQNVQVLILFHITFYIYFYKRQGFLFSDRNLFFLHKGGVGVLAGRLASEESQQSWSPDASALSSGGRRRCQ